VAYYRGYCRRQLEQATRPISASSGAADYQQASKLSTLYVFPHRHDTFTVLREALQVQPGDATARALLGALYLSGGMVTDAVREWEEVRRTQPKMPGLHRNLGLTLLQALDQPEQAAAVLTEGLTHDPANLDLYLTLDQALSLTGAAPDRRAEALSRYPSIGCL
jgi:predicted Zn-dependent protease